MVKMTYMLADMPVSRLSGNSLRWETGNVERGRLLRQQQRQRRKERFYVDLPQRKASVPMAVLCMCRMTRTTELPVCRRVDMFKEMLVCACFRLSLCTHSFQSVILQRSGPRLHPQSHSVGIAFALCWKTINICPLSHPQYDDLVWSEKKREGQDRRQRWRVVMDQGGEFESTFAHACDRVTRSHAGWQQYCARVSRPWNIASERGTVCASPECHMDEVRCHSGAGRVWTSEQFDGSLLLRMKKIRLLAALGSQIRTAAILALLERSLQQTFVLCCWRGRRRQEKRDTGVLPSAASAQRQSQDGLEMLTWACSDFDCEWQSSI